jgi:hypothetical protein
MLKDANGVATVMAYDTDSGRKSRDLFLQMTFDEKKLVDAKDVIKWTFSLSGTAVSYNWGAGILQCSQILLSAPIKVTIMSRFTLYFV